MSKDLSQKLHDVATGNDEPIGKQHPTAPLILIMMAYPVLLVVGILAAIALFGFTAS